MAAASGGTEASGPAPETPSTTSGSPSARPRRDHMTPSRTSTKTLRRSPREAWRKLRPFLGDSTRGIVALGATAVVGGFVEAAVMVIIVRIAVALASGDDTVSVHLGPIGH